MGLFLEFHLVSLVWSKGSVIEVKLSSYKNERLHTLGSELFSMSSSWNSGPSHGTSLLLFEIGSGGLGSYSYSGL